MRVEPAEEAEPEPTEWQVVFTAPDAAAIFAVRNMMVLERDKQQMLNAELDPGEMLLWSGQPQPFRVPPETFLSFIFGLGWTAFTIGFSLLWWQGNPPTANIWSMGGIGFDLFMLIFFVIGFSMLFSPFLAYAKLAKTVYGITDKRILIIEGGRSRQVESFDRIAPGMIKRRERADRTGDLTFAQKQYKDSDGDKQVKDIQFVGIPEVRQVEALLRDTLFVHAGSEGARDPA